MLKNYSTLLFVFLLLTLSQMADAVSAVSAVSKKSILLEFFVKDLTFPESGVNKLHRQIVRNVESMRIREAASIADGINENGKGFNPDLLVLMKSNQGVLHGTLGDHEKGLYYTNKAIEITEKEHGKFHPFLFERLIIRGFLLEGSGSLKDAENAFRRAQHLTHRQYGVYSTKQLATLNYLTHLELKREKFENAHLQQRFYLIVNEKTYGTNSEDLIPALTSVGSYFSERGDKAVQGNNERSEAYIYKTKMFNESISLFQRAVNIVESKYGENDIRLADPLINLAEVRLLQRHSQKIAERLMERATDIVKSQPASDLPDLARAYIALGDVYLRTSNKKAEETYAQAWKLLSRDSRYHSLREKEFASVVRIFPEDYSPLTLFKSPVGANPDDLLYTNLQFNLAKSGHIYGTEVVESNVSNEAMKRARRRLSASSFRPAMADGKFVESRELTIQQTFIVQ